MPCSGPRGPETVISASARRAASRARSAVTVTKLQSGSVERCDSRKIGVCQLDWREFPRGNELCRLCDRQMVKFVAHDLWSGYGEFGRVEHMRGLVTVGARLG